MGSIEFPRPLSQRKEVGWMDSMKWHKYSSIIMLVSALVCIYSGHKIVRKNRP